MTRVSAIIPTYNRAQSICEAIDSVLQQTRKPDEIVVVDDGSTDETASVLEKYGTEILLVRQQNRGVSAARNAGIAAASGDWITFLDSDDTWSPLRIEIFLRDASHNAAGMHVANVLYEGKGYEQDLFRLRRLDFPQDKAVFVERPLGVALAGPQLNGVAVRRDWALKVGGFEDAMTYAEDTQFVFRLAVAGPWLVTAAIVSNVRRLQGDSDSVSARAMNRPLSSASMYVNVFEELLASPQLSAAERIVVARQLSGARFSLASALSRAGQVTDSYRMLFRSASEHPSSKGWLKILPPLLLGRRGYEAVLGRGRGFYRDA